MNIIATEINLRHQALEIYLAGCTRQCPGCHNPETWDFGRGRHYTQVIPELWEKLRSNLVEKLWIMGGEPLDHQMLHLRRLVASLRSAKPEAEFWLFTSADLPEVVGLLDALPYFDYIKYGRYDRTRRPISYQNPDITLASCNQGLVHFPY